MTVKANLLPLKVKGSSNFYNTGDGVLKLFDVIWVKIPAIKKAIIFLQYSGYSTI